MKDYDRWCQSEDCTITYPAKKEFEDFRDHLNNSILKKHEILFGMQMSLGEMMLDFTPDSRLPLSYDDGSNWRYMHHGFNAVFMPSR